jgi:hypothetical protein
MLPAIAIGTNVNAAPVQRLDPCKRGNFVDNAGGDDQSPGANRGLRSEMHGKALLISGKLSNGRAYYGHAVIGLKLATRARQQFGWGDAVVTHIAVQGRRAFIAIATAVAYQNAAQATPENEGGA